MKHGWALLGTLILSMALVGCGGDDDDDSGSGGSAAGGTTGEGGAGGEGTGGAGEPMAWDDLDFDARRAFMAQQVMGPMQEIFAGYDEQYANSFTCGTCHADGLAAGTFEMPTNITPLSGAELGSFTFEGEGRQEIANVMASQVVPRMAEILGQEPFNPETNTGTFGCGSCHMIE